MAKKKSNVKSIQVKAKDLDVLKSELLKAYVKLKKLNPEKEIFRDDFIAQTPFGRYDISKAFRGFTKLRDEGDEKFFRELPSSQRALLSERKRKFNPDATKEDCITDLRLVQEMEPMKFITRNSYRELGSFSDSTWNQFFGTFQEFRKQAGLELSRSQHKLEKAIAKHASHDHYREYFTEEIMPYYQKYEKDHLPSKLKNIMIISDVHDEEADEFTVAVFIAECIRKQPDVIVFNGDIFDLYEFSRFTQDPRRYDIKARFQWVWDKLFAPIRAGCPNAQIDFIMGNHEFRLIRLLADATPNIRILLSEIVGLKFADVFKVDEYQINFVSKVDFSAFTKKDIEDQLKQNYRIYFDAYVICHEPDPRLMVYSGTNGHHHNMSLISNAFLDANTGLNRQVTWVQTPAAHVKDAEYLTRLSKWNTGFLDVVINIETKEVTQNLRQTHSDWALIEGIYYEKNKDKF